MNTDSDAPIPELWHAPTETAADDSPPRWSGPRRWWAGCLDVEGLALGSMLAVARALQSYGASVGNRRDVGFTSAGTAASFSSWSDLRVNGRPITGFAPLSGFRRAADGWVRLHANYPHHANALFSSLGTTTPDEVDAAIRRRSAGDVETLVTEAGGVAARVRTPAEWEAAPQAASLRDEPWIRLEPSKAAGRLPSRIAMAPHDAPLADVRVLDLTRVIAGPAATRLLGALGADVLRIDPPGMAELWDMHMDTGFDKRTALADFTIGDHLERVRGLIERADVVLTGYRGTALAKFGLDRDSLRIDHPDLAVVAFDAWGDRGPWADRRGFDSIVQAATGIAWMYGTSDGDHAKPGALPVQALDHATGMGAAAAILTLLERRRRGGSGSAQLSLARTALELMRLPAPPFNDTADELPVPLRNAIGDYGRTTFAPPPLQLDGRQVEYRSPPRLYGSGELAWE